MSTIVVIFSMFILALVILSKIPGLEHTVKPLIDVFFSGLKWLVEVGFSWSIWFMKLVISAHSEVIRNLIYSAEEIDPTIEMKNKM